MLKNLLNNNDEEFNQNDFAVRIVKNYQVNSKREEVFENKYFSILLIKSGSVEIEFNGRNQIYSSYDLLIIPKEIAVRLIEVRQRLQFYLLCFPSASVFRNLLRREIVDSFYLFVRNDALKITLEEREFSVLSLIYKLMFYVNKDMSPNDADFELRRVSLSLFFNELRRNYARQNNRSVMHFSRKENIAVQFLTVLSIQSRKHHNVKFYAGVLSITSAYLNKIIRSLTGKTAKEVIMETVLTEAMVMLEDTQLTVAEIAEELQFGSASTFSVFFKKSTSFSPSEYRANSIERS